MSRGRRAVGLVRHRARAGCVACAGGRGTEVQGTGTRHRSTRRGRRRRGPSARPHRRARAAARRRPAPAPTSRCRPSRSPCRSPRPAPAPRRHGREPSTGCCTRPTGADGPDQLAAGLSSLDRIVASRAGEQRRRRPAAPAPWRSTWPRASGCRRAPPSSEPWLDGLATTWGTGVRTTDFRSDPETARKAVNSWVPTPPTTTSTSWHPRHDLPHDPHARRRGRLPEGPLGHPVRRHRDPARARSATSTARSPPCR